MTRADLRVAFLNACRLDVAVRKPGNVSLASPGHGMDAAMFIASAEAAAGPLLAPGASVGRRIDGAGAATLAVAGCNTNLGILLLCAPIAAAFERVDGDCSLAALRMQLEAVLAALDLDDAAQAFNAIARANPGGLGTAAEEDVHAAPTLDLREAMALAADRDSIARQYANGFADLFDLGWPAARQSGDRDSATTVQRLYLSWLATVPDSHIVRKRGDAVAQAVTLEASDWCRRAWQGEALDGDAAFAEWDNSLKSRGINPGTSADLTVATLFLDALIDPAEAARMPGHLGVPMGFAGGTDRDTVFHAGGSTSVPNPFQESNQEIKTSWQKLID